MREIAFQVLAYVVTVAIAGLASVLIAVLKERIGESRYARIREYTLDVVRAVEQYAPQVGWSSQDKKKAATNFLRSRFNLSQAEAEMLVEAAVRGLKAAGEELKK